MSETPQHRGHAPTINLMNKREIGQAFGKAARSYDQAAQIQRQICHLLQENLPDRLSIDPSAPFRILDAGCGTGYGLQQLLVQDRLLQASRVQGIALDLSPAMLATLPTSLTANVRQNGWYNVEAIAGDMEHLPVATGCIDLYWSSLAAQWCDPGLVLGEAARVLRPAGWLALATLGPQTFLEMRQAFAAVDAYQHTLDFVTADTFATALKQHDLHAVSLETRILTAWYPDLRTLLGAVKAVGANRVAGEHRRHGMMGKQTWRALEAAYERFRTRQGLPLRYEVLYCHAVRQS